MHELETLRFHGTVFRGRRFRGKQPDEVAMLCSYRYYVRPNRVGSRPSRAVAIKHEEAASQPPAPEAQDPIVVDTPPHVAIVRQYAW